MSLPTSTGLVDDAPGSVIPPAVADITFDFLDYDTVESLETKARDAYHRHLDSAIDAVLTQVRYKPGSTVEYINGDMILTTVEYDLTSPGNRDEMPWTYEGFRSLVEDWAESVPFADACLLALRSIIHEEEAHEADEWIVVAGVRLFDPHRHDSYRQPETLNTQARLAEVTAEGVRVTAALHLANARLTAAGLEPVPMSS